MKIEAARSMGRNARRRSIERCSQPGALFTSLLLAFALLGSCRIHENSGISSSELPPAEAPVHLPDCAPLSASDFVFIRKGDSARIPIYGMSGRELEASLGMPSKRATIDANVSTTMPLPAGETLYKHVSLWYPGGLWIEYGDDPQDGIWWLTVTGDGYATPRGIEIGSTEAALKDAYGSYLMDKWGPKKESAEKYRGLVSSYKTYGLLHESEDFKIEGEGSIFGKDVFMLFLLDKEDRVNLIEIVRPL